MSGWRPGRQGGGAQRAVGTQQRRDARRHPHTPLPTPALNPAPAAPAAPRRLHVARTSKGSGKPLLLLVHGFPEAWFSWRHQMGAFRRACVGPEAWAVRAQGWEANPREPS